MEKQLGTIKIYNGSSLTLGDLEDLIKKCEDFPRNTPLKMCQISNIAESNILNIIADKESINFYDWL